MRTISEVEIEIIHIRKYYGHSAIGEVVGYGVLAAEGAPHIHAGELLGYLVVIGIAVSCRHFLPSFHLYALLEEPARYAFEIIFRHLALGGKVIFVHQSTHLLGVLPASFCHFVAAEVYHIELQPGIGIHLLHLAHYLLEQGVGAGHSGIEHIVVKSLCREEPCGVGEVEIAIAIGFLGVGVDVFRIAMTHRHYGCSRVAGGLYFGYHFHAAFSGIFEHFHKLAAGDIAVGWCFAVVGIARAAIGGHQMPCAIVVERKSLARCHFGEFGHAGNLEAPRFIVVEVKLESIDFIRCEPVYQVEQLLIGCEVARHIEHHAAIGKIGIIAHLGLGDGAIGASLNHCGKGFDAIEHSFAALTHDGYLFLAHFQLIILAVGAYARAHLEEEFHRCLVAHLHSGASKSLGEIARNGV